MKIDRVEQAKARLDGFSDEKAENQVLSNKGLVKLLVQQVEYIRYEFDKLRLITIIVCFVLGISLILSPYVSNYWKRKRGS